MDDPAALPQPGPQGPAAPGTRSWTRTRTGPLDHDAAAALLRRADELLAAGEFASAARHYQRVIGALGRGADLGRALRAGDEPVPHGQRGPGQPSTWEQVLALPETSVTYRAWREIAAMRVRDGDLAGAQRAYREAERRAPPEDRAEIASRLGWLAKEMGDTRAATRYFSRSRDGVAPPYLTYTLIAVTTIISVLALRPALRPDGRSCSSTRQPSPMASTGAC